MTGACHFCGAAAAAGEHPGNALCEAHQAIHGHVIAMSQMGVVLVAQCQCGWRVLQPGADYAARDEEVRDHWASILQRAAA